MKKRNPLVVVALAFLTFTIYAYYWLYKTTDELKEESGREELSPIVDVLLALVTFGLWGLWAGYRNAKITHELFEELGAKHTDRSLPVAIFGAGSFFTGWAWLVSMALLQDDLNRLADVLDDEAEAIRFEASRPRTRARVSVEPDPVAPEKRSRWEDAPSAPVFESKAPAPHVF